MENSKLQTVYIAYGSNMGEWIKIQKKVFPLIELRIGTVLQKSKTYISPAWGKTDQPDFKNGVILAETALNSLQCLQALKKIELDVGRVTIEKWGPRIIDLDIIDFNGEIVSTEELTLPHPYAHKRQFVLEPLAEIAPNHVLPHFSKSISEILSSLADKVVLTFH
ncbi:MAG: 2-amino-4-hydroxy-6-hydroxymethyldihydropteridine diphosphokinase [Salibacteraceae bacterium]|jgi:2-amino-4-hydroxy-6-hydroxymethyldihydropteridine diphosphokinase|tara:strand:- start:386 stop:880 length:495 start_codon:yes stop_codon:yes gene_type:complete